MKNVKKIILLTFLSLFFVFNVKAETLLAEQNDKIRPTIRIFNLQTFTSEKDIYPFEEDSSVEGLNISTFDLNNDNSKEIIVASGSLAKPLVKILNSKGELQSQFLAYDENDKFGFKALAADLYNNGQPEIITAPNEGATAQIRVFNKEGKLLFNFLAFPEKFKNGATIAVADINNDSQNEFIIGAGRHSEPIVKIFDNNTNFIKEFYAFEKKLNCGVNVLAADINNDHIAEIITAPISDYEPKIKIFNYNGDLLNEFLAYDKNFLGGVNLASGDIDNDGQVEILTGPGFGGGAHLRIFNAKGQLEIDPRIFVYAGFRGGISLADGNFNNNQKQIIVATQTVPPEKIIKIDLSKQKLFAYSNGVLEKQFTISTGKNKYPTPTGDFKIESKLLKTNMARNYGPDNPDNYDLPDVPHVMYFYKGYAIHGAYWHWRFGTRVSHGCVNLKLKDAEWLYNWAPLNTLVNIYASAKKL